MYCTQPHKKNPPENEKLRAERKVSRERDPNANAPGNRTAGPCLPLQHRYRPRGPGPPTMGEKERKKPHPLKTIGDFDCWHVCTPYVCTRLASKWVRLLLLFARVTNFTKKRIRFLASSHITYLKDSKKRRKVFLTFLSFLLISVNNQARWFWLVGVMRPCTYPISTSWLRNYIDCSDLRINPPSSPLVLLLS